MTTVAATPRVIAVVVSYTPEPQRWQQLMAALRPQVDGVIVVDNGTELAALQALMRGQPEEVFWLGLPENRGVASAQNLGIRLALQQGADYVLLMDHDSVPAPGMVDQLLQVAQALQHEGYQVAAVGPCYLDQRQDNPPPFVRSRGGRLQRQRRRGGETSVEVDYLISSGCLLPRAALEAVGLMREGLFIDYVDIEWGWRAAAQGYLSFGAWEARMDHALGDQAVRFLKWRFPARSADRYYYMYRNAVVLLRHPQVPARWKVVEAYRLVLRAGFWLLFTPGRAGNLAAIWQGLADGWAGRAGPRPERRRA